MQGKRTRMPKPDIEIPDGIGVDNCIQIMQGSRSIEQWNNNRELIKDLFSGPPHQLQLVLYFIDASGLIVETLGKDLNIPEQVAKAFGATKLSDEEAIQTVKEYNDLLTN